MSSAQTNPVPVSISYAESFSTTPHSSTVPPLGWQGWRIGATASSAFETAAPTTDVALIANSTAAVNTGGIHNYNGAIGILNSGTMNAAIVLSISTSAHSSVQVSYQLSTIRNPYNGSSNTRIEEATLQYRVGTSGPFTTLPGPVYTTGSTAQTTAVTTPLDPVLFTQALPIACDHQPIVQLRWVVRDLSGFGSRPSIAIDQVTVTGVSHPLFSGGAGRGDVSDGFLAAPVTANLYLGGSGRGEKSDAFTAAPITASIYGGGAGRGDVSDGYTAAPMTASLYLGGNGRGEKSDAFTAPSITASIYGGGAGRGDVSDGYTAAPVTASLYLGGNGRGEKSDAFTAPSITASIYSGGTGRGDVSDGYTAAPVTASLYLGGNGRGEKSDAFTAPSITASIYSGGTGRGDVSDGYTAAPVTASIYAGGHGRGEKSDAFTAASIIASIYGGGAGRGDESDGFLAAPVIASLYLGGNGRGDKSDAFTAAPITASIYAGGVGRGEATAAFDLSDQLVALVVRALLGGPFDPLTGLQHDSLRTKGLLPSLEPYTLLGYDLPGGGGELIQGGTLAITGPDAPVDWVVVELRAPQQPSQITAARCLLLQRDGDVVDPVTGGTAYFTAPPGNHYISIRHRNHLGAMTALPVALDLAGPLVDFSQPTTGTFGTGAQRILAGRTMLWPGDVTSNGTVKYAGAANDRDPILTTIGGTVPTAVVHNTYATSDVNMDGRVKYTGQGNDRDIILQVIGGTVPTNVRNEQIP
ncbi:MAG: hypothetical protein IPM49_10525 [Flavobacteriales bacterium]|nr:hypothetical protein [Flavobacteriales bacterium]